MTRRLMRYACVLYLFVVTLAGCDSAPGVEQQVLQSTATREVGAPVIPAPTVLPSQTTEVPTAPVTNTLLALPGTVNVLGTATIEEPYPPVVLEGNGTGVSEPFTVTARVNRITLTHDGIGPLFVRAMYSNGSSEYLLNATGRYRGSRLLLSSTGYLEIEADGRWTATIEYVGDAEASARAFTGAGDTVGGWFTPVRLGDVSYQYMHTGERNFYVQLHCALDHLYSINEVGVVEGTVVVAIDEGPCLWDVQADGNWEIRASP